jgi:hypothetical protein
MFFGSFNISGISFFSFISEFIGGVFDGLDELSSGPLAVMCNSAKFKRMEAQEFPFLISLILVA